MSLEQINIEFDCGGFKRLLGSFRQLLYRFPKAGDALLSRKELFSKSFHLDSRPTGRAGDLPLNFELTDFGRGFLAALRARDGKNLIVKGAWHGPPPGKYKAGKDSTAKGNRSKGKFVHQRRTANGGGRIQQGHIGKRVMRSP